MRVGINFEYLNNSENAKSIVLWGGRGSGKTHDSIDYIINHNLKNPYNSVITRRYDKHVRATYDYFKARLLDYPTNLIDILHITKNPMEIHNKLNGNTIYFRGLDNPDNSIKGLPRLNLGWFEEASEGDGDRYMTLYNTIREGANTHLISSFNPVSANNWTKRFFFESGFNSSNYHSTVLDNPFIDPSYIEDLKGLKNVDQVRYEVDFLGRWGVLTDLIYFKNVHLIDKIPEQAVLIGSGVDFGIADPTVVCKTFVHAGNIYIETLLNLRNLPTASPTGYSLADKLKEFNIPIKIQADSEDLTSIHTLRAHGLDVIPALKGKGSIIGGIRKLQMFENIYILNNQNGESTYTDFKNYHRKKLPSGIILDDPADGQEDHTVDAVRYSLSRQHLKF